jgi:uncharacterized membrane protein YciS (DUF1049 family)
LYDLSIVFGAASVTLAIGFAFGWILFGISFSNVKRAFEEHEAMLRQQIEVQFGELERMSTIALKAQRELVEHKRARN